jgi:hypothetical protein
MRPTTLANTLKDLFHRQRTVCIEGAPGGGKTSIVRQVAGELGLDLESQYIEIHLPTALPEDFGIPFPKADSETFSFKMPEWFPVEGKAPEQGIVCIDDRNQGSPDLQKILANICQARTLHGKRLPKGWTIVSTGNRQADKSGANRVLAHLRDRETVIPLETHLDDWTGWAIDNGVPHEGISFIRYRPNLLHDFDPQKDISPTPRSWVEGVFNLIGAVPKEAEYEVFAGAVGEGAAAEFTGFLRIFRKLPNPDTILMNPKSADVPDDPATLYAISGALANKASTGNLDRLCQYLERIPREFSVLTMSSALRRDTTLASSQAFTKWAVDHQDVLF